MKAHRLAVILSISTLLLLGACSNDAETFHVTYANASSAYYISALYVKTASGGWSSSYIPAGELVSPNYYFEFDIPLNMGELVEYYVTVQNALAVTDDLHLDEKGNPLAILQWAESYRHQFITVTQNGDGDPVVTGHGGDVWSNPDDNGYTKVSWQ
ncbi:MAG TPA: hypothetical protein PLQ90_09510 [Sphaerochaeta sp.]|nr:hypothetical protein [Sphaerochaeta sp.]